MHCQSQAIKQDGRYNWDHREAQTEGNGEVHIRLCGLILSADGATNIGEEGGTRRVVCSLRGGVIDLGCQSKHAK